MLVTEISIAHPGSLHGSFYTTSSKYGYTIESEIYAKITSCTYSAVGNTPLLVIQKVLKIVNHIPQFEHISYAPPRVEDKDDETFECVFSRADMTMGGNLVVHSVGLEVGHSGVLVDLY